MQRLTKLFHKIKYVFYSCTKFDSKLIKYQAYRPGTIITWKKQMPLSWATIKKILFELKIYDSPQIRSILRSLVSNNSALFNQHDCYITNFGEKGKSGDLVLYELTHAMPHLRNKVIEPWEIAGLPANSTIVFVDDLIGTGRQSFDYITETLNRFLNASHKTYLLCLCATTDGHSRVVENTSFDVISAETPKQYLIDGASTFIENEKAQLTNLNAFLSTETSNDFNMGLLIAFYYGVPNNTMPIVWKDKFKYINHMGKRKEWFALLPRSY